MAGTAKDRETPQPDNGSKERARQTGSPRPRAYVPEPPTIGSGDIDAALIVCAPDGTVIDLNRAAAGLLACDREDALGRGLAEIRDAAGTSSTETGEAIGPGSLPFAETAFAGRPPPGR